MRCLTLRFLSQGVTTTVSNIVRSNQNITRLSKHFADYVGYWPTENTVIVAHEGTDPTQL